MKETIMKFDGIFKDGQRIFKFYGIKVNDDEGEEYRYQPWGGGCALYRGFPSIAECKLFIQEYIRGSIVARRQTLKEEMESYESLIETMDGVDWIDIYRVQNYHFEKDVSEEVQ